MIPHPSNPPAPGSANTVSAHESGADRAGRPEIDDRYRAGVGIILLNRKNEVFVARRNDVVGNAWQMPQGGVDAGETPEQAARRELKEEIGTDKVELVAESRDWLYYELPPELAARSWDGRWIGQRQKWLVMLFTGEDDEINLATEHPEFDAWRWVPVQEIESLAAPFRRRLYASLLGEFSTIFRD